MTEDKTVLTADQVDSELTNLTGWTRGGTVIYRDFVWRISKTSQIF